MKKTSHIFYIKQQMFVNIPLHALLKLGFFGIAY